VLWDDSVEETTASAKGEDPCGMTARKEKKGKGKGRSRSTSGMKTEKQMQRLGE
jgi:hypothetical protein